MGTTNFRNNVLVQHLHFTRRKLMPTGKPSMSELEGIFSSLQDHIRWKKQWHTLSWRVWDWQACYSSEISATDLDLQ